MKLGYKIENFISSIDKTFELVNYDHSNTVILFGWINHDNIIKDKNTVGVWKIKNKKK